MNIFIRDDQGLDTVLMMDGYSWEQRQSAKQAFRAQFREMAIKVFQDVLSKPLPESITVNMAIILMVPNYIGRNVISRNITIS